MKAYSRSTAWLVIFLLSSCTESPKLTTNSPEALKWYNDGVHQFENFYYVEAKNSFDKALQLDSNFAMASARLAYLHVRNGNESDAKAEIARALQVSVNATKREQLFIRLLDHIIHFRNADAAAVADTLIDRYPKDAEIFVLRGNLCELNKRHDRALEFYQRAVRTDTAYGPAAMSLGYAYSGRGDFDRAIQEMERYIRLSPNAADPRASFADVLLRAGRYEEALQQYQRSLEFKPDYWYSIGRIGDVYMIMGRLKNAETQFDLAMTKMVLNNQVRASHLTTKAILQMRRGEYTDAVRLCEQSLALDSLNIRAAYIKVRAFARLGKFDEAEQYIDFIRNEITRRNLGESMAMLEFYGLRAHLYRYQGRVEEAVAACDSAMEYGSELTRADIYHELAEIHLAEKDYESALDALEEALRYNPNAPSSLLTLTKVYKALGDKQMVQEIGGRLYDLWKNADPDFQPLLELKKLVSGARAQQPVAVS